MVELRVGDGVLVLDWAAWERRVQRGEVPADAVVRISALTGEAWVRADSLQSWNALARRGLGAFLQAQALAGAPLATALLVGLQLRLVLLAQDPWTGMWVRTHLTKWSPAILQDGAVWRLLTMGVAHVDLFGHAVPNLLWLAFLGWNLERALGARTMLWLYTLSVLGGSLLSLAFSPATPSIGASGGIFGLIGAAIVLGVSRAQVLPERLREVLGLALAPYVVLFLWLGTRSGGVDNAAHFGGLVTGGLLAVLVDPPGLDRRPGWTLRVRAAGAAIAALLLGALALAGPALTPLETEAEATVRATFVERGVIVAALPDAGPVHVRVPAGWPRGSTATGEVGWQLGDRAWAVLHARTDAPRSLDALRERWEARVRRDAPRAVIAAATPTSLAGVPAVRVEVTLPGDPDISLVWIGAVRGRHTVEAVWQTETTAVAHLTPLHDKLLHTLTWDAPDIDGAVAAAAAKPGARDTRRALALAYAEHGLAREAFDTLAEAAAADTVVPSRDRVTLIRLLGWYPDSGPPLDATLDAVLTADPSPTVVEAVADLLDARDRPDDARGLLALAWARAPGERTLARTRLKRGLSNALTIEGLPWAPGPPEPPAGLSIEAAAAQGAALSRLRAVDATAVGSALDRGDASLAPALVRAMYGHPPLDAERDLALAIDGVKRQAAGSPVPWWDPALPAPQALADALDRADPAALSRATQAATPRRRRPR